MANIEYGPTSPNATNGTLRSGKHSAASGGGNSTMGTDGMGPRTRDRVSEGGRIDKAMKWSSGQDKPQLNLTNDPSANVMSKIRAMKFSQNQSWKAPSESSLKQAKWS